MKTSATVPQNAAVGAVTNRKQAQVKATTSDSTDFGRVIQTMLGKRSASQEVSEEELFAASCFQIFKQQFGVEMARDFKAAFKLAMVDKPATEQYPSAERAAKEALDFFVKSTIISKDEADAVRQMASRVCQLDDKKVIWDGYGDTKSVTTFADAQTIIGQRLEEALGEGSSAAPEAKALKARKAAYQPQAPETDAPSRGSRRPRRKMRSIG